MFYQNADLIRNSLTGSINQQTGQIWRNILVYIKLLLQKRLDWKWDYSSIKPITEETQISGYLILNLIL
jgi:hypothetical protein